MADEAAESTTSSETSWTAASTASVSIPAANTDQGCSSVLRRRAADAQLIAFSPWAGIDEEAILSNYMVDAGHRWRNHRPEEQSQQVLALHEDPSCEDTELTIKFQELHKKLQEKMQSSIVRFRGQVLKMAKTVFELAFTSNEKGSNPELENHVEKDMAKIKELYDGQRVALEELEREYKLDLAKALQNYRTACTARAWSWLIGSFMAMFAGASGTVLRNPASWALTYGFGKQSFRPSRMDRHGTVHYASNSHRTSMAAKWSTCLAASCFLSIGGILYTLWQFSVQRSKMQRLDRLVQRIGDCTKGAAQSSMLWGGLFVSVEKVKFHVDELKEIGEGRDDRKRDAMIQIMQSLYSMGIAMDEFVIYAEMCRYFPPNLSIRNEVGQRYDRIYHAMRGLES